jgi:hypothetical protein
MPDPEKPFFPRWARYLLLPGMLGPVFVLGFIFVDELAHEEERCPYVHGETRPLGRDVYVREDTRVCIGDVEDHRYSVIRAGRERSLARRRFRAEAFAAGRYEWKAELSDQDEVRLHVKNLGHEAANYREGTPAERAADAADHAHKTLAERK